MIIIDTKDKDVNDLDRLCWFNLAPLTEDLQSLSTAKEQISAKVLLLITQRKLLCSLSPWMKPGLGKTGRSDDTELHHFAFP